MDKIIALAIMAASFFLSRRARNSTASACFLTGVFFVGIYLFTALGIHFFLACLLSGVVTLVCIVLSTRGHSEQTDAAENRRAPTRVAMDTGSFTCEPGILSSDDSRWASAHYSNGVVYFDYGYSVGTQSIGYYEPATDNLQRIIVMDKSDRGEIGIIDLDNKYIFLSRMAIYERSRAQDNDEIIKSAGMKAKYPIPPTKIVAEIIDSGTGGYLLDIESNERIGTYRGGMIGAAAAFVSLTSELHMDTKYHDFQSHWDRY